MSRSMPLPISATNAGRPVYLVVTFGSAAFASGDSVICFIFVSHLSHWR